jgi:prepilin signal peptidase PulO-like enzyme (type II secretory pathway)
MIYFLIFFLGASVGSFINVLIYRLPKKEKITFSRSMCPNCFHQLSFLDLIPIFSFLFLKGKCRYCGKKISFQYPLVELATGFLFLFSFISLLTSFKIYNLEFFLYLLKNWLFITGMIFVFVYDLKYMLIEDKVVIPLIILILILNFLTKSSFSSTIFGGFLGWFFFYLQYFLTKKRGIGEGDLILGVLIGIMFGWPKVLIAIFISYLIGGIISLFLLIVGKKTLNSKVPLGPFLAIGSLLTLHFF